MAVKRNRELLFLIICSLATFISGCNGSKGIYENVRGKHLILENGNKSLFWFSGIHSNDPESQMFPDIHSEINKFKPSYILVEGGFSSLTYKTETEAILDGESAFASYIAHLEMIPCGDIEPSTLEINQYLATIYTNEKIIAMYLFRQIYQWQRESANVEINIDQTIDRFNNSQNYAGLSGWEKEDIARIIDGYVGFHIDNSNWKTIDAYTIIYTKQGQLFEVWKATYDFRNQYILQLLPELYKTYDRIFIVMGFDHAEELRNDLTLMMKKI